MSVTNRTWICGLDID